MLLWLDMLKLELSILSFTVCLHVVEWIALKYFESLSLAMETEGKGDYSDRAFLNQGTKPDEEWHTQEP